MKYKTKLIITKLRDTKPFKVVRYFYHMYLKLKNKIIKMSAYASVKTQGRYSEVSIGKYKLILDKAEIHDYSMMLSIKKGKIYEPEVTKYITQELMQGQTFMDIGANNGYYTVLTSQIVGPKGRVLSVEPNYIAFNRLMKNVEKNELNNVSTYNFALSDFNGKANLHLNTDSEDGLASLLNVTEESVLTTVNVNKFDDVFENETIDLVKMDAEGSEIAILRGMENYLLVHKKIKIIIEWNQSYRTIDDFEYIKKNFEIFLLLCENGTPKKITINYYSQLVFSNLLLIPK